MPGYVDAALKSCIHPVPSKHQYTPYPWTKPDYEATVQYAAPEDTSETLSADEITHIQHMIGKLYYYARAVDRTLLTTLGELASTQTQAIVTKNVTKIVIWFLNYAVTQPDAKIRYQASGTLHIDIDSS